MALGPSSRSAPPSVARLTPGHQHLAALHQVRALQGDSRHRACSVAFQYLRAAHVRSAGRAESHVLHPVRAEHPGLRHRGPGALRPRSWGCVQSHDSAPWVLPQPVIAFMQGGIGCLVISVAVLAVSVLMYTPFTLMADRQALREEQAALEESAA